MNLDVLAFAAHRDDLEITCGGTLARLAEQGHSVGACDLTEGEMGTRGSAAERLAESEEAARILGLKARVNCGLPDAGLFNVREQQLKVIEVLRRFRPSVVLLPALEQRHPDHATAPRIVFDACYFSGLAKFPDLKHDAGRAHRPRKIYWVHNSYTPAPPTFVVDVTAQMEKKVASILAYRTQFPDKADPGKPAPRAEMEEWVRSRATAYGLMIGKKAGEGFIQREAVEVEDLVKVLGKSI